MKHTLYLFTLALIGCGYQTDVTSDEQVVAASQLAESHQSTMLCPDIKYTNPKYSLAESDLTSERADRTIDYFLDEWGIFLEEEYQSLKKQPSSGNSLMEGDVGMSFYNRLAFLDLYRLNLEALTASPADKDSATAHFCKRLSETILSD